jgi:hypothetical protein
MFAFTPITQPSRGDSGMPDAQRCADSRAASRALSTSRSTKARIVGLSRLTRSR